MSHGAVVLLLGRLEVGLGAELDVGLPAGPALARQRQKHARLAAFDVNAI